MRDSRKGFRTMTAGELRAALAEVPDDMPVVLEVSTGAEGRSIRAKVDDVGVVSPRQPTVVVEGEVVQVSTNFVIVGNAWDPDRVIRLRRPC